MSQEIAKCTRWEEKKEEGIQRECWPFAALEIRYEIIVIAQRYGQSVVRAPGVFAQEKFSSTSMP